MLAWSLVLSLAALRVVRAYPILGPPQYGSFGEHGGVATEVRACTRTIHTVFLNIVPRVMS